MLWRIDLATGERTPLAEGVGNERSRYGLTALPNGAWALMAGDQGELDHDAMQLNGLSLDELF